MPSEMAVNFEHPQKGRKTQWQAQQQLILGRLFMRISDTYTSELHH